MPTSFLGSALRGTFFLIFGLWWSVRYTLKYLGRKANAENQPSYGVQRMEFFEGAVKAFFALAGILVEQFVPAGPHLQLYSPKTHSWTDLAHWHYTTMYLFFLLSGIVDIVSHSPLKLPLGLDRLSLSLALFIEGLLFCFRDYSDAALDHHLHSLLAMAIFAGALCALLEVFLRDHIILETFRTSSFLLQGSWLWQIGFVLCPPWGGPGWDQTDRSNFTFLTMCFCWHYAGALAVLAANSAASRCCNESCQLKFGDIDVELDCGMCVRKGNKSSSGALLPESGSDDKAVICSWKYLGQKGKPHVYTDLHISKLLTFNYVVLQEPGAKDVVRYAPCVYLPRLVLGYLVALDAQLVLVLWGILKFDESVLLPGSTVDTGPVQHWWSPKKFPGHHLAARRLFSSVA